MPLHPIQIQRFREMSPTEKHKVFQGMVRMAREIKRASITMRHPKLTPAEVERKLAGIILHGKP